LPAARDVVLLGQRQPASFLLECEKRNVAVHESGHALVATLSPAADPVETVTILPTGMALGVTEQLTEADQHLLTELQLHTQLVVFGQGSTGASSDLASATQLATRMVREFGLSPSMGPVGYTGDSPQCLGDSPLGARSYSDTTQRAMGEEVSGLLREAESAAVELPTGNRQILDDLSACLVEHESADSATISSIIDKNLTLAKSDGQPEPRRAPCLRGACGPVPSRGVRRRGANA
jgi:cell division protease FtsH